MKVSKPAVQAEIVLSMEFDETRGALTVSTTCRPNLNLGVALGYLLTAGEAKQLGAALTKWAESKLA
jgi:hypothetical protein